MRLFPLLVVVGVVNAAQHNHNGNGRYPRRQRPINYRHVPRAPRSAQLYVTEYVGGTIYYNTPPSSYPQSSSNSSSTEYVASTNYSSFTSSPLLSASILLTPGCLNPSSQVFKPLSTDTIATIVDKVIELNDGIIEVTSKNMEAEHRNILRAVMEADFIAFDQEFGGLESRTKRNRIVASKIHNDREEVGVAVFRRNSKTLKWYTRLLASKFQKLYHSVKAYSLVQLGITTLKACETGFKTESWSIYVRNMQRDTSVSAASGAFLARNGFDWNKFMNESVSTSDLKQVVQGMIKKPLLGHNCLADIMFLFENFFLVGGDALSASLFDFSKRLSKLKIYDTKNIALLLDPRLKNKDSNLTACYQQAGFPEVKKGQAHGAGFDSLMTARIFMHQRSNHSRLFSERTENVMLLDFRVPFQFKEHPYDYLTLTPYTLLHVCPKCFRAEVSLEHFIEDQCDKAEPLGPHIAIGRLNEVYMRLQF
jgi:DNA polymerase III epsilon subunit-like protein